VKTDFGDWQAEQLKGSEFVALKNDIIELKFCNCGFTVRSLLMDVVIQVRSRGVITLPAELREKYGIENGDIFRLVDLDGVFVLTPMVPMVPELAREIEKARLEAGLSIEDLLHELREQRQRYSQEKYGTGENS
jgi:bifunctional DNA-binding transcriptional regulator/antitoxin component of YhaV-PrlF toxin-antitoxin module